MPKFKQIKIMEPELASRIAAGEVVGRPASVVKELIENSLDAGSKSIEIEVSLPRRRIRVKDDGSGIAYGEMELALARHGTSKIQEEADIFGIGTYGFRGEALPSIASVSRLTLSSCRRGSDKGRRIQVEGGKIVGLHDSPPLEGTEVLVENLFYNTPARQKFVRSHATEMTHVTSRVIHAALGAVETRFVFIKEKTRVLELPPATTAAKGLGERVRRIFGAEYAENLVEIDYSDFGVTVKGLVGKPDFNRATAMDQYFFVNNRPVKDGVLRSAVARAFLDLLPRGRKPVIFLHVSLKLESVDVNVHPCKEEVRYSNPSAVASAIVTAIRKALGGFTQIGEARAKNFSQDNAGFGGLSSGTATLPEAERGESQRSQFSRTFELWSKPGDGSAVENVLPGDQLDLKATHGRLGPKAVVIGQFSKTFLMLEEGERLIIMDQHTVHERILYERLMKRYRSSKIEIQMLLTGVGLKADPGKAELVRAHLKTFADLGWGIEECGPDDFVIRHVPALMVGKDYAEVVNELLEAIFDKRDGDFGDMVSDCVSRMACRAAVMAGDALSQREITAMVEELSYTELPYTCPHGRPIALEISREKLFRDFGRTG